MKFLIYFSCLLVTVLATGDLIILSHPKSLAFKGHERVDQSILKEVYSAAMGFSISRGSSWSGMFILDPFNLPEAVVTFVIDGISQIGEVGHRFPLRTNENEDRTWTALKSRVEQRFPYGKNKLVHLNLEDGLGGVEQIPEFKDIRAIDLGGFKHLNRATEEDQQFLKELAIVNGVIEKVENGIVKQDRYPDVFWFVLPSLHPLSDLHGENSSVTIEAKQLLVEALLRLNDAFHNAYNGNAFVTVVTTDASHTRIGRSLQEDESFDRDENDVDGLNLAKNYDPNYPVIFNILLWFGVAMFFSLLAVCIVIANMDPGRDSIIYRMTSNRMKKDN